MKGILKNSILFIIIISIIISCAACGGNMSTGKNSTSKKSTEQAFKNLVQSAVNKYGILNEESSDSSQSDEVNGLWDARAIDVTYDGNDELVMVYVDNNTVNMDIYEFDGKVLKKAWSEATDWGGIYHFNVCSSDDGKVFWYYGTTRGYSHDVYSYKKGRYQSADAMHDGWTDEEWAKYGREYGNSYDEGDLYRTILKSRFDIHSTYENETILMSVAGEGPLGSANKDELIKLWDIKIPEPKISPTEALSAIPYYGNAEKCRMTKEMALAYVKAIEGEEKLAKNAEKADTNNQTYTVKAILMDLADDGMPLLLTGITIDYGEYMDLPYVPDTDDAFNVWTWNGKKAKKYNFKNDIENSYTFGYTFRKNQSEEMIIVGDGDGLGSASGHTSYKVKDAQLTKVNHIMVYHAYREDRDSDIMTAYELPGVNARKYKDWGYCATIDELMEAGWKQNPYASTYNDEINELMAIYVNGKILKNSDYEDAMQKFSISGISGDTYDVIETTTGGESLINEWANGDEAIASLGAYSKVCGRPFYKYEEVTLSLEEQIKAITKKTAEEIKGEIGEIYRISDDLYLVVIYTAEGDLSGTVIVKNTAGGTDWKIVKTNKKAFTEDDIAAEINKDSQKANVKIDTSKASEGTKYLEESLKDIDGTVPNTAAKDEIIKYIETAVSKSSQVEVKAKNNVVVLKDKNIKKAIKNAQETAEEFDRVLTDNNISLDKPVATVIYVVIEKLKDGKSVQVTLDAAICESLTDGSELMLILDGTNCSIKLTKADLENIIKKHGNLTITLEETQDDIFKVQFTDQNGKLIEKLDGSVTFALPAENDLCTIWAEYTGGADNWGGLADASTGTISFTTPFSGTYTVTDKNVDISDISMLPEEHQRAIRYMVSKGYFALDGDKFHPESALRRYDFSEAIVGMFFALDPDAKATFADITKDDPYYKYVASGQKLNIIEGYDNNTFGGENVITKEQALALCSRTLKNHKGYASPESPDDYLHFSDKNDISKWAKGEVALAVREALTDDGGRLNPTASISRADSALLLYRLFMLLHKVEPVAAVTGSEDTVLNILIWSASAIAVIIIALISILVIKKKRSARLENADIPTAEEITNEPPKEE